MGLMSPASRLQFEATSRIKWNKSMHLKLSKFLSRKLKTKFVFLVFSLFSILGIIDAHNSSDHIRICQYIGLSLVFLAGFLDGSFAEKNISSMKDLLSEDEEIHSVVWWLQTVGFWLFFSATILLAIRYFGSL